MVGIDCTGEVIEVTVTTVALGIDCTGEAIDVIVTTVALGVLGTLVELSTGVGVLLPRRLTQRRP